MLQQAFLSIKLSPRCHYEVWLKKKKEEDSLQSFQVAQRIH